MRSNRASRRVHSANSVTTRTSSRSEFNAWHYVEGNLWASLVEHIFSNLKFEGTDLENLDSEPNIQARLDKMLKLVRERATEADTKDQELAQRSKEATDAEVKAKTTADEAEKMKASADQADRESVAAFQAAQQKHASAQIAAEIRRTILLKDAVENVVLSPQTRAEVESGLEKLGIGSERLQTIQGVREALKEATETGKVFAEGFDLLRQNSGWLLLLWVVAVPLAVVVGGFVFDFLASQSDASWFQRVGSAVSGLFVLMSSVVASWKKLSPQLKPVVDAVNKMKAKRFEVEAQVEAERMKRAEEAAQAEHEVNQRQTEAATQRQESADKAAEAIKARQDADNKRAEAERVAKEAAEKGRSQSRLRRRPTRFVPSDALPRSSRIGPRQRIIGDTSASPRWFAVISKSCRRCSRRSADPRKVDWTAGRTIRATIQPSSTVSSCTSMTSTGVPRKKS